MRVLFATAELAPLVRVGGLAEAASGLVRQLRAGGADVVVALPDYSGTPLQDQDTQVLDVPDWAGRATARTGELDGFGTVTLIDLPRIRRSHPYMAPDGTWGWADNDQRFIGFSVACAELARVVNADVLHANDWHTGASFAFCDPRLPTVFSIHNLAYQGQCDIGWLSVFGPRAPAYAHEGTCNPMAGALVLADRIVTVSPTYAREIRSPEHGNGLDGILRSRSDSVTGIRNGIDSDEWNPESDPLIMRRYGLADAQPGKHANRRVLRERLGLPVRQGPVIAMVTRLVQQKGLDLALGLVPYLASVDAQLAVLGSGDPDISAQLRAAVAESPDRVTFSEGYDIGLSHQVFAGSDLYLMPSRFEPCGLSQMQAMRYGSIPIVTDVGGLHDTVVDVDDDSVLGNGFVARAVDEAGLVDALHRAARRWSVSANRRTLVDRGMSRDWSWGLPAAEYEQLYRGLGPNAT